MRREHLRANPATQPLSGPAGAGRSERSGLSASGFCAFLAVKTGKLRWQTS